jgi:Glycosyltransferase family 87
VTELGRRFPLAGETVIRVASLASLAIIGYVWWRMALQLKPDDSYTFWHMWRDPSLYPPAWRPASLYVYSPAFAQAFWPLTLLSWPVLNAAWAALQLVVLIWMVGPIGAVVALAFPFPFLVDEGTAVFATINNGNPMILTAAAITLGLTRWPGAFSFVLLTKVSAGVGILYFAIRRQWKALAIALGVTLAITAVSALFAFNLWVDWIRLLLGAGKAEGQGAALAKENFMPIPFELRATLGALVVAVAAWRRWLWLVPVGCFLALPDIHLGGYAVLTAIPAVWLRTRRTRSGATIS